MIRYAGRAVPWTLALAGYLLVVLAMGLVGGWPDIMWPMQGTAIGLLAGVAAWAQDEPAAGLVDTLPRSLRWRTIARTSAAVVAVLIWVGCLVLARHRLPPHLDLFLLQGVVAVAAAIVATSFRRSRGEPEPGRAIATAVIPTLTALALIRPLGQWLPLFPIWTSDRWGLSIGLWLAAGALSLACPGVVLVSRLGATRRTP